MIMAVPVLAQLACPKSVCHHFNVNDSRAVRPAQYGEDTKHDRM
jgi:hypothetical protein